MKSKVLNLFIGVFAFLTFSTFSFAAEKEVPPNDCKKDVESFCKKVKPGEGRVVKCLKENEKKITVACKENLDEVLEVHAVHSKMKNMRQVCKADLETFCVSAAKGQGRQVKCLKANEAKISSGCRATLETEGFLDAKATTAAAPAVVAPAAPVAVAPSMEVAPATVDPAPAAPAEVKKK